MRESIAAIGILHPPILVPDRSAGKYRLVAGAGRFAAAKSSGLTEVWALVMPDGVDSPRAKLAFLDENIIRVDVNPKERDMMFKSRAVILEQMGTRKSGKERLSDAGKKGKRGKKITSRETREVIPAQATYVKGGKPASGRNHEEESAIRRMDGAAATTWELYGIDDGLNQSQLDELVKIKDPEVQADIAQQAVGMTLAETKVLVSAARAVLDAPRAQEREVKALVLLLKQLDQLNQQVVTKVVEASRAARDLPGLQLRGFSGWAEVTKMKLTAAKLCELADLLQGSQ